MPRRRSLRAPHERQLHRDERAAGPHASWASRAARSAATRSDLHLDERREPLGRDLVAG